MTEQAGAPRSRLELALEASERGNFAQAAALAQQSIDFRDADASESRWLLERLINEPDAFRLLNAIRLWQSGSHREGKMLLDRLHTTPFGEDRTVTGELQQALFPQDPSLSALTRLKGFFEIIHRYPFEVVVGSYQAMWTAPAVYRLKEARIPNADVEPQLSEVTEKPELTASRRLPNYRELPDPPKMSRGWGFWRRRTEAPNRGGINRRVDTTGRETEAETPRSRDAGAPDFRPPPAASRSRSGSVLSPSPSPSPFPVEAAGSAPRITPAEERTTIRRTPHLELESDSAVDGLFSVLVYADERAPASGEDVDEIAIPLPKDLAEIEVEVWLVPSNQFAVIGPNVQPIRIRRDTSRSTEARFTLAVRPDVTDLEGASVSAYFNFKGRPCGRVRRVIGPGEKPAGSRRTLRNVGTTRGGKDALIPETGARLADILVEIVSDGANFRTRVRTKLVPGYEEGIEEIWPLDRQAAEGIVHQYFADFMTDEAPDRRRDYLIGAGKQLFRQAPKAFQRLMLGLDRSNLPTSLLVCSEEPYVPWELMVPNSRGAPRLDWDLPIGVLIPTGRWVSTDYLPPVARVRLDQSYLIAPTYNPPLDSSAEARILTDKFSCQLIRPAALSSIDKTLEEAPRGLIHFACHGNSSPESRVQQLTLEGEALNPTLLEAQPGFRKAIEAAHPLVFLNACEVGRVKPGLVATSGFAESFIALGAGAVIAPLWQVDDVLAGRAAQDFYDAVARDPDAPFARVVSDIRRKAYARGAERDDSYAAYTLYGDPTATRAGGEKPA